MNFHSSAETLASYPRAAESIPELDSGAGAYRSRFARSEADLRAIQRLRFEVFNLELSEGLDESYATGLDVDPFDRTCHHLMVIEADGGSVVGTYRVQTQDMAAATALGWYTASEYDLSRVPTWLLDAAVETGRACVAKEHRNGRVLQQLWRGLAAYLTWNHKRFLFGCCSLTTQDPSVAWATRELLASGGFLRRDIEVRTLPAFECFGPEFEPRLDTTVKLPALFAGYLKLGAKIVGEPALDRQFKTIDFLALLDIQDLDAAAYRTFFER